MTAWDAASPCWMFRYRKIPLLHFIKTPLLYQRVAKIAASSAMVRLEQALTY